MKQNDAAVIVFLILLSAAVMALVSHFSTEAFLFDDNRNQWMPVMDKAYDSFFATGHMPNYNFYLAKGMEIADQGFYSLNNPIMLLSYVLYRFVLMKSWGSTISVYIYMMFTLGNITAYLFGKKMGLNTARSVMIVLMYMSCSAFVVFGVCYYVYNNYFVVPLILYTMLRFKDSQQRFFACGIILAFSLTLGNVQYTVYQYMMYCVIMLTMVILGSRKRFWEMISNCVTGIVLSLPSLILLMQSSARAKFYSSESGGFLSCPLNILDYLVYSLFPSQLMVNITDIPAEKISANSELVSVANSAWVMYIGGFGICVAVLILGALKRCGKKIKSINQQQLQKWASEGSLKNIFTMEESKSFYIGAAAAIWFFFSVTIAGFAGKILSFVPVVNQFRYAFKGCYIMIPLLIVPAIYVFRKIQKKHLFRTLYVVCAVFSVIGLANQYFSYHYLADKYSCEYTERYEDELTGLKQTLKNHSVDTDNYRIAAFTESSYLHDNKVVNKITRNLPVSAEVFSLGAYDQTESQLSYQQSDLLYTDYQEVTYYNEQAYSKEIWERELTDMAAFEDQLIHNAVRYIIISENSDMDLIREIFDQCEKVHIKNISSFTDGCLLMEIDGVDSICKDEKNRTVGFEAQMDCIQFQTSQDSEQYRLSFTCKDRLSADYVSDDGTISQRLAMTSDENGYITITTKNLPKGTVTITYHNGWIVGSTIFSVLSVILFVGILFVPMVRCKRKQEHCTENTEDEGAEQQ